MRHFRLGLLICAVLVLATTVVGQGASGSDPQATALLQRALAALTGGAPVTDATLTGTARRIAGSDDETGTATLKATASGDSRIDLSLPSGNRAEIRNHAGRPLPGSVPPNLSAAATQVPQPVGAWSGSDGALHVTTGQNLLSEPTWFQPALTLSRLVSSPLYVLSYIGPETRDGQTVVHISAWQASPTAPAAVVTLVQRLSKMDIYLDSTTLLPVALAFNAHPDNNALVDIPTDIRFSDYRTENGILIPFHVQRYFNHGLVLDLQFGNAALNSGLVSAAFDIQ
jgi:hypothetical protein